MCLHEVRTGSVATARPVTMPLNFQYKQCIASRQQLKAAGVDRHVRGWENASDHAPVWVTLKD